MTIRLFALMALTAAMTGWAAPAGAQNYVGEVRTFTFPFCPAGFVPLDGRLLPVAAHTALFSLLGTRYGGDGITTFAVPTARPMPTLTQGAPLIQCMSTSGTYPDP